MCACVGLAFVRDAEAIHVQTVFSLAECAYEIAVMVYTAVLITVRLSLGGLGAVFAGSLLARVDVAELGGFE